MSASYALQLIFSFVADTSLNLTPWLNLTTACTFPSPWYKTHTTTVAFPPPKRFPAYCLQDYLGKYGSQIMPDVEIKINGVYDDKTDALWLHMNKIGGKLLPTAQNDSFQFQMEVPWEYAIERVHGNYNITYKTVFFRDSDNEHVIGFNISLDSDTTPLTYLRSASGFNVTSDASFYSGVSQIPLIFTIMVIGHWCHTC